MYFPDLEPFKYGLHDPETLAVGWLDRFHRFVTGPAPAGLADALLQLAAHPRNLMRGFHLCNLCGAPKRDGREYVLADGRKIRTPQLIVQKDGRDYPLGNGEIIVRGSSGRTFAAPTLVYHYVAAHAYLPPAEFVNAVLAQAFLPAGET